MNVNLTPSVDNSKVTNVTKSASTADLASSDSGETKGFLDKLASLLLGGKGEAEQSDGKLGVKVSSEGEGTMAEADSVKSSSTDAILAQEEGTDEGESVDVEAVAKTEQKEDAGGETDLVKSTDTEPAEIPENLKGFIANDDEEQVKLKAKTAQAMDDGDKILGRLQEANQTLVKKDGKALPHAQIIEQEGADIQSQTHKESISGAQIVNEESQQAITSTANTALNEESEQAITPTANTALSEEFVELPEDHPLKQAKNIEEVQALSDSEIAAIVAKQSKVAPASTQILSDDLVSDEQLTPTTAAIPWASNTSTENGAASAVDTDGKVSLKTAQHGAASQPVHQALQTQQHQQLATQADKALTAQSAMPSAMSSEAAIQSQMSPTANVHANPMLASAMLNQADPAVSQAALKAGLSAKALAGLADGKQKGQAADTNFAQQLSAAAGQQGVNGPQSLRADALQAQQASAPLQMARSDMAADEVAERVQVMLSKNLKNIDIRLDPPELGRMHIRMNMNSDGATVHFTVANQQARDALEQSMPRLREMLNNQGVQLGDTSVQQQSSGQQQRYTAGGNGSGGQSSGGDHMNSDENLDTNVNLDLNVAAKRDGISYYA